MSSELPPSEVPLFSIVAEPTPPTQVTDVYIESVIAQLQRAGTKNVARAFSIASLHRRIQEFAATLKEPKQKFRLQIIGHGDPGSLSLGAAWSGITSDAADYYALDSDPGMLNILAPWRDRFEDVILAGCLVGSPTSRIHAANGTTLLFTLEQLWNCKVYGATGNVVDGQFDDTGRYIGPLRTWDARDLRVTQPGATYVAAKLPAIRFMRLVSASGFPQLRLAGPVELTQELSDQILATYGHRRADKTGPGLAKTELGFEIELDTPAGPITGSAGISFDAQCLTIELPEPPPAGPRSRTYYFASEDQQLTAAVSTLRGLLTPILPAAGGLVAAAA